MDGQEFVGDVIRRARGRLGYSQYAFADELARVSGNVSLTRDEVARWERGRRIPGPYWRQWLSRVLQVPAAELAAAARVTREARAGGRVGMRAGVRVGARAGTLHARVTQPV